MKVMGIDPGIARLGYGVIEYSANKFEVLGFGCIETSRDKSTAERLGIIVKELEKIIKKHKPEIVGVEEIFFSKNVKTAINVAQSRGLVLWLANKYKINIKELKPAEVKLAVCGVGNAPKLQIQKMVTLILDIKKVPKLDDTCDALACAIAVCSR